MAWSLTAGRPLHRELSVGRGSTDTLGGGALPKIQAVDAWDGKDGQVSGSREGGLIEGRPPHVGRCIQTVHGCLAWTLEMAIFSCAVSTVASSANLFSSSSSQILFLSQLRGK